MKKELYEKLGLKKIDIDGYSGYYINSKGEVYSTQHGLLKKLKPFKVGKYRNYLAVRLYKNKKGTDFKVHRLVALYFIDNPQNLPQVNHIDGNTFNNNVDNLEWCTNSENQLHAWNLGLNYRSENCKSPETVNFMSRVKCYNPIVQFDNNYNFIDIYGCVNSCKDIASCSSINKCCSYELFHAGKYKWRHLNDCKIKNKIIVLSGKSASGKNHISNECKKRFDMNELISYTTRPRREGEREGVEYYFINDEDIKEKANKGELLEIREYKTIYGKWYYSLGVKELKKNNPICILDYKGLKELERKVGKTNIISIFIDVNDEVRLKRALSREKIDHEKEQEIIRRLEADDKDFKYEIINKDYDYIVKNNNKSDLNEILELIKNLNSENGESKNLFTPRKYRDGEFKFNNKYFFRYKDLCEYLKIPISRFQFYRTKKGFDIYEAIQQCLKKEKFESERV